VTAPALRWAAVASGALAALAAGVVTGAVADVDERLGALGRPGWVWGPAQVWANVLVDGLQPAVSLGLLGAVAVGACVRRLSPRPAVPVAVGVLLAAALVVAAKYLVARPDPADGVEHGGSFPSGHTASLVVCSGLVLLLVRPDPPWRWWLVPAALGAAMGTALVVVGAHWATDSLGGELLGLAVLAVVRAVGGAGRRPPAAVPGPHGDRRVRS
jgi:membrane-associated phospholipid phosphatase